jgi:hypothetical protein
MNVRFGLLETLLTESDTIICSDNKCGRDVMFGEACFIDIQTNNVYCESCGKCLRYERKKEEERRQKG